METRAGHHRHQQLQRWLRLTHGKAIAADFHQGRRLRLKIPPLKFDNQLANELESELRSVSEVRAVSTRPQLGTVLLELRSPRQKGIVMARIENWFQSQLKAPAAMTRSKNLGSLPSDWHTLSVEKTLTRLGVTPTEGLSSQKWKDIYSRVGPNRIVGKLPATTGELLVKQFSGLPVGLLGGGAVLSLATGGLFDAVMITSVLGINGAIGFHNDFQVEKTLNSLKKRKWGKQTVLRGSKLVRVPTAELVPGDILYLTRGMMVPADCRLIQSEGLTVDESSLSGEGEAVLKDENWVGEINTPLSGRINMLYRLSAITGGAGRAVVVETGDNTELGRVQKLMENSQKPQTPIQKQMDELGRQLSWSALGLCGVGFGLGLIRGKPTVELIKNSVSLAIAAIPEGLPMVATTTLVKGVNTLRNKHVLVRNLNAVEGLGSLQHICLDKTGTITKDEMVLEQVRVGTCLYERPFLGEELGHLFQLVSLNTEVRFKKGRLKGSSTEKALVHAAVDFGINVQELQNRNPLMDRLQRTQKRHYVVTQHQSPG